MENQNQGQEPDQGQELGLGQKRGQGLGQNHEQAKDGPKDNPVVDKSLDFAVKVVKFSRWLKQRSNDFEIINQFLRSGTSIGANVAEAQGAQSKADFIAKMQIALKETHETIYWLNVFVKAKLASDEKFENAAKELSDIASELKALLSSILKTSKTKRI